MHPTPSDFFDRTLFSLSLSLSLSRRLASAIKYFNTFSFFIIEQWLTNLPCGFNVALEQDKKRKFFYSHRRKTYQSKSTTKNVSMIKSHLIQIVSS
jgi:hypothetical protein